MKVGTAGAEAALSPRAELCGSTGQSCRARGFGCPRGQMGLERELPRSQGAPALGESSGLPPDPFTSPCWGPRCLMVSHCGSAEGHMWGQAPLG